MKMQFLKYACIALAAGFLVTGVPGEGYARLLTADTTGTAESIDFIDNILVGAAGDAHVCSDKKGTSCTTEGEVIKCKSKKGVKLCQTCTCTGDPKVCTWGSGAVGDCWGSSTASVADSADKAVLGEF